MLTGSKIVQKERVKPAYRVGDEVCTEIAGFTTPVVVLEVYGTYYPWYTVELSSGTHKGTRIQVSQDGLFKPYKEEK